MKGSARSVTSPHPWDRALHAVPRSDAAGATIHGAQRTFSEVRDLQQALASSRDEASAAHRRVMLLAEANARLRETVAQRDEEIENVRHLAFHDGLTGLPNRALLLDRLGQALVRAQRQQTSLALLLLDLDGFKAVNDGMGHDAGDRLLQRVAERLLSCVRGGDTACRYGGDEFVVLLPEVDDEKHALAVAQKIHARLARSYRVDGCSIVVTASIGVAVYPADGASPSDMIHRADCAMYRAKSARNSSPRRSAVVPA